MNTGTKTARSAPLSRVAANAGQTQNAGFPGDFQDLFSFGMDQAIEIQKASLSTVVCLNSCAIDIYQNAFWFAPVLSNLFDAAAQSFTFCMELQLNWLTLLIPASHAASPSSSAEELAHSMDIAIGEQATATASSSTVASSSGTQAQPKAEVLETDMDIAIGARKVA